MITLRVEPRVPSGRPQKYAHILMALADHDLFTPAAIMLFAVEQKYIEDTFITRRRLRITMGKLSKNHEFPAKGDGIVTIPGQAPTIGWWGHRWKNFAKPRVETK